MNIWVQWTLIALGVVGAAGTWFRAWIAYIDHKDEKLRRWSGVTVTSLYKGPSL